jgi:hypothetical protein
MLRSSEPEAFWIIIVNAARELPAITQAAVPLAPPIAAAARPPCTTRAGGDEFLTSLFALPVSRR